MITEQLFSPATEDGTKGRALAWNEEVGSHPPTAPSLLRGGRKFPSLWTHRYDLLLNLTPPLHPAPAPFQECVFCSLNQVLQRLTGVSSQ